ncbi:TRAP transporter permease [Phascolarctobacterium sp.]|uniref:TRAP transporter permease n=1 Tax=Phascolarctobacterium sp. TaxID=2049039 RepID=UPI002A80FDC7|nr:TRAP transporter permease [Phascolarctobacterium sp.]MDY5045697.1 TRAP transporter permease [Phascolarctobacterium sp.]
MSAKEEQIRELSAEEVLQKFDKESNKREMSGLWGYIINGICILFAAFQLYTATFGILDAHLQRAIHLTFGFLLIFLLYPTRQSWSKTKMNPIDVLFALAGACSAMYIVYNYNELVLRAGMNTETDFIVALIGTVLVFEAARRVVGWPMIIVALVFLLYAFFGPYVPGIMAHRGVGLEEMFDHLFFTTEGIFGTPMGVSSTFIYLFILFGAYLEATGLGKFFIDLANAIAGWAAGGPAKVAVLSSGLMGTVSGSSVGNVAGTGSFTIPMMKKLGYRPAFAGAVEAAASTGGQLMPPVMGAAAFLMAEFVGVPYFDVVKAAVIPAMLYYIGVWLGVHYEAKKFGLKGTPRDQLPKFKDLFLEKGHLAIPLIVIIYLLVSGYTPMRAALAAIALSIICACLRKSTRISFKQVIQGLIDGSKGVLGVLIACATAGIIIGVVTKTGVGLKVATALLDLAGGKLLPAMFFTMITSLILGMGVPTTANYVITSTIAAPALIQMQVPVLAAHMFAFYFGIVADVTPPVALAAYAGAGIAGANPMRCGVIAAKLAIAAFIVPYIFVLAPELLMINATAFTITYSALTAIIGMWGVSMSMIGFCQNLLNLPQRLAFLVGGVCMIIPGTLTDGIGIALIIVTFFWQKTNKIKGAIEQTEDL